MTKGQGVSLRDATTERARQLLHNGRAQAHHPRLGPVPNQVRAAAALDQKRGPLPLEPYLQGLQRYRARQSVHEKSLNREYGSSALRRYLGKTLR